MRLICKATAIVERRFDECLMPCPEPIDIFPAICAAETDLIRGHSHYGAILLVQRKKRVRLTTRQEVVRMKGIGPSCDERPGYAPEWVSQVSADAFTNECEEALEAVRMLRITYTIVIKIHTRMTILTPMELLPKPVLLELCEVSISSRSRNDKFLAAPERACTFSVSE